MTEIGIAVETYRGFTIDISSIHSEPDLGERRKRLQRQIDIVADCGLPQKILLRAQEAAFLMSRRTNLVHTTSADGAVENERALLTSVLHDLFDRPLSPELLQNLQTFYGRALANNIYPRLGPALNSPAKYFAVTATAFLLGASLTLTRERIEKAQPAYFRWLTDLLRPASEIPPQPSAEKPVLH